ncbi:hypothetical protein LC608_25560 [Nostoc sp. XA010]|uniref:hypothetical protein n=1 Tax=Nostoc sp. XA010 TaxID=2780407 RepID=UPI001E45B5CD|nr:hypothetical protein [Nostoc sp. XA010]MCC5660282.1 hypothetical protein [Nostoc sp. XA010]
MTILRPAPSTATDTPKPLAFLTALLTSKILGFTVPSDPKPREAVGAAMGRAIAALDYLDICGWWCWNGK